MTISEKIKQALHIHSNVETKDWIVEGMIENTIGVSFALDTPTFCGEITLIEVPENPNIILYVRWIDASGTPQTAKTLIYSIQFIPFLVGLDNKTNQAEGHRAPKEEEMCIGVKPETRPYRFHP